VRSTYTPYPFTVGGVTRPVLMVPGHREVWKVRVTTWTPHHNMTANDWSLNPTVHLDFAGRSASPEPELHQERLAIEDLVVRQPFGVPQSGRVPDL
jgi:hypothetical protein